MSPAPGLSHKAPFTEGKGKLEKRKERTRRWTPIVWQVGREGGREGRELGREKGGGMGE